MIRLLFRPGTGLGRFYSDGGVRDGAWEAGEVRPVTPDRATYLTSTFPEAFVEHHDPAPAAGPTFKLPDTIDDPMLPGPGEPMPDAKLDALIESAEQAIEAFVGSEPDPGERVLTVDPGAILAATAAELVAEVGAGTHDQVLDVLERAEGGLKNRKTVLAAIAARREALAAPKG